MCVIDILKSGAGGIVRQLEEREGQLALVNTSWRLSGRVLATYHTALQR
jgi:hypothetical protein